MQDPLATYLADHLAGSVHAIELIKNLKEEHVENEQFLKSISSLLFNIEMDREILKDIAENVGTDASKMKELGAWLGEKLGRLKLGDAQTDFGVLERLEVLELGIYGKRALWAALKACAFGDARLHGTDFDLLIRRATEQLGLVEEVRLDAAQKALRGQQTHTAPRA